MKIALPLLACVLLAAGCAPPEPQGRTRGESGPVTKWQGEASAPSPDADAAPEKETEVSSD